MSDSQPDPTRSALVLFSGGQDSATCLAWALERYARVETVGFDYGQRHVVKPGLTGWAQVRYSYGSSVEDAMEKLQYDLFYIKNLSLAMDLLIVLSTLKTVLSRRGV